MTFNLPNTIKQLAIDNGMSIASVARKIREMHKRKEIHICAYRYANRQKERVFDWGDKPDAVFVRKNAPKKAKLFDKKGNKL